MTCDRDAMVGTPVGVLAGTCLAEFARDSRFGDGRCASSTTCC